MFSKCFAGVFVSVAASAEKKVEPLNLSDKDMALRNYLAKNAPCPVEGAVWSLVNVVDYNFDGFASRHLTDHSTQSAAKIMANVPLTPNLTVVRDLALAAKLAYEDRSVVSYICKKWDMVTDAFLNFGFQDTQAYVMYDDQNVVLSFRGTEIIDPKDWATDLKVKLVNMRPRHQINELAISLEDMLVKPMAHIGFLSALGLHTQEINSLSSPYTQIHQIVGQLVSSSQRKLWITGHSLGGALASVFVAQMLIEEDPLVARLGGVYTYGQPRSGNSVYCNLFNCLEKRGLLYRIVNRKDIVPRVPLESLQYRHHGCEIAIKGHHKVILSDKVVYKVAKGKYKSPLKKSPYKKIVFALLPEFLEDHYPCEYVRNIEPFIFDRKISVHLPIQLPTTPPQQQQQQPQQQQQRKGAWWEKRKRSGSETTSFIVKTEKV